MGVFQDTVKETSQILDIIVLSKGTMDQVYKVANMTELKSIEFNGLNPSETDKSNQGILDTYQNVHDNATKS